MAGSTFQPPVHLDPGQDPAQQIAFINQNFQSLAAVLETNSFRIISSGVITIPGGTLSGTGTGSFNATPLPHGLNFAPSTIGFASGNIVTTFPNTTVLKTILPNTFYTDNLNTHSLLTIGSDKTYIYASNFVDYFDPSVTVPAFDVTYYLINVPQ